MLVFVFYHIYDPISINMFIAIFILLICTATRIKRFIAITVCISTYMEIFLEPNIDGRNWETRCHYQVNGFSSQELDKRSPLINFMFFRTISACFFLGVIPYILYLIAFLGNNKKDALNIIKSSPVNFIFTIIMCLILIYITLSRKEINRDMYIEHWKEVKRNEKIQ